jgi:hypothetical protein
MEPVYDEAYTEDSLTASTGFCVPDFGDLVACGINVEVDEWVILWALGRKMGESTSMADGDSTVGLYELDS